jgi:putative colanic acid biosysnthesis UDP-glucose lipid carrier transferase
MAENSAPPLLHATPLNPVRDALATAPAETSLGRDNLLSIFESSIGPGAFVVSLWALAYAFEGEISPQYLVLAVIVFALAFPSLVKLQSPVRTGMVNIGFNWAWIAALLVATGWVTGYLQEFSNRVIITWVWVAPLTELAAYLAVRGAASRLLKLQGPRLRAIIVGMNDQGLALASKISAAPFARIEVAGFVDSRGDGRLNCTGPHAMLGSPDQLPALVKAQRIQIIYLSLPMASQPRIIHILDELKDTTASIYFVPDMFVTDLIQGHAGTVCGMPVISVCETPFKGTDGAAKRISDIALSFLILLMIAPLLLIIAIAVKAGSPGPAIFKQRRYGLDGEEIVVYKFRSMSVTEDGTAIQQAKKNDARVTPLGAFLRRTSLDELPQFINVLQGRMSIVGPRPHAVAHNEMYRKLIKGYMVRHKVKPGITGLAQVNGYRGETQTLDKMQGRIDFDLDYLRNWSLRLDLHIILKTIRMVVKDQSAY